MNLKVLMTIAGLTMVTLSYQQCAPANFASNADTNVSKAAASQDESKRDEVAMDLPSQGDGEQPAPHEPDPASCVSKKEIKIENKDGVPMAPCLKNSGEMCVVVCHVPPGNAKARHTILISPNALQAHLNHGSSSAQSSSKTSKRNNPSNMKDSLGECGCDHSEDEQMVCEEA